MEPEYITYKRFNDIALAGELADLFERNDIKYFMVEEVQSFNPTFSYSELKEYTIKIKGEEFEKGNQLLKTIADDDINIIDKDYYLLSFSNNQLIDVITKEDEWNAFDVQLSRKLLVEKGITISDDEISGIRKKRIEELKTPESSQKAWIIIGYLFAICGGILGFFIGWHLSTYKKTLPNGEIVFGYTEHDRKQGKRIFYLSFLGLIITFAYKITTVIS